MPATDRFLPPPNVFSGDSLRGRVASFLRIFADLQVSSVLPHVERWLKERGGRILEVGAGAQPYKRFVNPACQYVALDWASSMEHFGYASDGKIVYGGGSFPLKDGSFDAVFHTEVVEHIYETAFFLRECRRVLKPGGALLMTAPFAARYHYIPHDYWRLTPAAFEKTLSEAGFTGIKVIPRGDDVTVAMYKIVSLTYRLLLGGGVWGKIVGMLLGPFAFLCLLAGHLSLAALAGSTDDTLGYVVSARADGHLEKK